MRHKCVRLSIQTQFGQIGTDCTTASQSWKPTFVRQPTLGQAPAIQWTVSQSQQFQSNSQNCPKIVVNLAIRQQLLRFLPYSSECIGSAHPPTLLQSIEFCHNLINQGQIKAIALQYRRIRRIAFGSVRSHWNCSTHSPLNHVLPHGQTTMVVYPPILS